MAASLHHTLRRRPTGPPDAPTLGSRVAFAATVGRTDGPDVGLSALDRISDPAVQQFQPAWATRAHLLADAGRADAARQAYDKAISLTTDPAIREYLERRRRAGAGAVTCGWCWRHTGANNSAVLEPADGR